MKTTTRRARPAASAITPTAAEARIDWLLAFLRRDLAALRPGELLDLRNDVFAYLHEATLATVTDFSDPDLRALKPARAEDADPVVVLARDLLARVQGDLRAGVDALHRTGSWQPFGLTPDPERPAPHWLLERRTDGTVGHAYAGKWRTITLASAADLLAQWWPELRVCKYESCGVLFRPEEGRQKYHDPKCSGLARWKRLSKAPKPTRDYVREEANAARREALKKMKKNKAAKKPSPKNRSHR